MHTLNMYWAAHNENRQEKRQQNRFSRADINLVNVNEEEFVRRYRLNKLTFLNLCNDLELLGNLKGTSELPIHLKVMCALSFLATGSYQKIIGLNCYLPQQTTSLCIREVVDALNSDLVADKWIKFPSTRQERELIKQGFQRKFKIPGVIGCIDGTHIAIIKPDQHEEAYFNRKGYHSLNVQMVCDSNLKIINVNSRFGGRTHDSHIWAASSLESHMRDLYNNRECAWLLGDSGYPQRAWLMLPLLNAEPGSRAATYTKRHIKARNCIERCFGVLKARWRCLLKHRVLHYTPTIAGKIVVACSVLHNIALDAKLPIIDPQVEDNEHIHLEMYEDLNVTQRNELTIGRAVRNSLINRRQDTLNVLG